MSLSESMKKIYINKINSLKKAIIDIKTRAGKEIASKEKEILDLENKLKNG